MSEKTRLTVNHWVLIGALCIAVFSCYRLIEPYSNAIMMAFILSLLIFPIHQRLEQRLAQKKNLTALLSCIILTFIIVIPSMLVFSAIIQQGARFAQTLYHWGNEGGIQAALSHPLIIKILTLTNQYLPFHEVTPQQIAQKTAQFATSFGSSLVAISAKIVGDVTHLVMNFFLMLFVLFFLLRDHDKIINVLRHILPLSRSQEDKLLHEIQQVSKSAIMGSFLTAIAQGVAGGFAMWIVGLPGLFWGTMMGFASFIPLIGTALIWVPATLYLFIIGDTAWALFLLIWSIAIVGSIDNLLRPLLMQGSAGMNTLMIFFSLLGGIQLFGLIGLIYGPLIFAITIILFNLYEEEFAGFLNQKDRH